jgi:hypothetical protein
LRCRFSGTIGIIENVKTDQKQFDWVTERSLCSVSRIFEQLGLEIQQDVDTRNAMRPAIPQFGFEYAFELVGDQNGFAVHLHAYQVHKSVTFKLADGLIEVLDANDRKFQATVGLNDDGACMIYIDGKERSSWHLRKLALDHLFFGIV